jgi:hypothetical protein
MNSETIRNLTSSLAGYVCLIALGAAPGSAQTATFRTISGTVVTDRKQVVSGVSVTATWNVGSAEAKTDRNGAFHLVAPRVPLTITVVGNYLQFKPLPLEMNETSEGLELLVNYFIAPVQQSLVISATALNPTIDQRNDNVYKSTLFSRDDQIFDTLASGINAGQHEGGGKSLEIRRFGFNLDHGGVNGGLKVLVDDVQQNQATQGHGQGYLGALKSLTPELVSDVDILNGPFSAEYGDFSGLGVVHIRLKESLPNLFTIRMQGGSFGAYRSFIGYSPDLKNADAFLAYERSYNDGPFINPGRYGRNNVTGNFTRHLSDHQSLGFRLNTGTNDFYSSGQIPLDLVDERMLNRYGYIDPNDGGRVRLGTLGVYFRDELANGDILKMDGFVGRSLFYLYSNFTFFLNDPVNGDEIQQHDSRLQEGVNAQYLRPYKLNGHPVLITIGANLQDSQINVGLFHTRAREVLAATTSAYAHVPNAAAYIQQGIDLLGQRLHFDAGLRLDYFRFDVDDRLDPSHTGIQTTSQFQPKANASYSPSAHIPVTLYASYGRGISSQDARGVVQQPNAPKVATTDFYQFGSSHQLKYLSLSTDVFLIDRSAEQVYIPDDGTFEFKGPSRSYGWEAKTSARLTKWLVLNGGFTRVSNAYYRGVTAHDYVDNAPHSVANSGLTVTDWRGFNASLRYRHIGHYLLEQHVTIGSATAPQPPLASGLDVVDFSLSKRIRHGVDFNIAIDNLNNKKYWETQNYFVSRLPGDPMDGETRVHGTPGFPVGVTAGLTFRLGER